MHPIILLKTCFILAAVYSGYMNNFTKKGGPGTGSADGELPPRGVRRLWLNHSTTLNHVYAVVGHFVASQPVDLYSMQWRCHLD
jgi:hypothetical protein